MNKYLVTGAPGSGKSTYVKKHHGENDIIFDWDDLFVAVTGMPSHSEGTEGQKHVVNRLRYDLIRAAENAEDIEGLWVIASKPSDSLMEALGNYEEIHLEVDKDEAKRRVDGDDSREDKEAEHGKIDNYFSEDRTMPINSNREYRNFTLGIIDNSEERMTVVGYASTFNQPYTLMENDVIVYREQVDQDAFKNTDMSDVIMQYNHEGRVFARVANNTLHVIPDERGLFIEADLGGTELGRQLYEEIKGGYTDKMSFGFVVNDDIETRAVLDDGRVEYTRTIRSISKLYDVSAVSIPANDATSISVRNLTDGVIDQIRAERLEAEALELRRRKLLITSKLKGGH